MRFDAPGGTDAYYEPNSFGGPQEEPSVAEPPLRIAGNADRFNHRVGNDDYEQPGDLFRLMSPKQRELLMDNNAEAMRGVPEAIQLRQVRHFTQADSAYGAGVAARLGLKLDTFSGHMNIAE